MAPASASSKNQPRCQTGTRTTIGAERTTALARRSASTACTSSR
jgi:hypothetical protein